MMFATETRRYSGRVPAVSQRRCLNARLVLTLSAWFAMIQLQGAFGFASISKNQFPVSVPDSDSTAQQQQLNPTRNRKPKPIPITVLSGFLGSGKTSLLQHLLHNKQGLRIAIIVNDVASVNIDSKLIMSASSQSGMNDDGGGDGAFEYGAASGMVELQNGCACCSKSEELLSSVSELVMLSDLKGEELGFHHIVVEMSGVADPKSVRAKFQEAVLYDMPLMDRVRLDTMVTVIDCSSFLNYLVSGKSVTPNEAPELFYPHGKVPPPRTPATNTDWMDDLPAPLLEALLAGDAAYNSNDAYGSDGIDGVEIVDSGVSELLVGQTETADVILLNKVDLIQQEEEEAESGQEGSVDSAPPLLAQITQVVTALNPRAKIYQTQYGNIDLSSILAVAQGTGVVEAGVVDDHRDAVAAVLDKNKYNDDDGSSIDPTSTNHDHDSTTASSHAAESSAGATHSHSHDHNNKCVDETQSNSHDHNNKEGAACMDSDCTDPSHSHSHSHSNTIQTETACLDADCTDPSHSHSHDHSHQPNETHAGIGSFVYRARRPFHPQRLLSLLRKLPVTRGLPEVDDDAYQTALLSQATCNALKRTLRSKGFIWCADSNIAALYWSHAGASFDLQCLGRWWSTLPRDQWPSEAVPALLADFDDPQHSEDEAVETVGDRRQEIVFIGQKLGGREDQQSLQVGLDHCLLNDDEWATYRSKRASEEELQATFANPIPTRMVSY